MKFLYSFLIIILIYGHLFGQNFTQYDTFSDFERDILLKNDTTYIINFFATWCKPCMKELPYFDEFSKSLKAEKIKVVLVSLDIKSQINKFAKPIILSKHLQPNVVFLTDRKYKIWMGKVNPNWHGEIPSTLLLHGQKSEFVPKPFETISDLNSKINSFNHN